MDVLSDGLRAARLTSAAYFGVSASQPWIAATLQMKAVGATMMPGAGHVIPFHAMVAARGWATPQDPAVRPETFEPGDIVMFPHGEGPLLTSDADRWEAAPPDASFYTAAATSGEPFTLCTMDGGGAPANFVCGYLGCDASPFNPLLSALPRMLIVKAQLDSDGVMKELLRAAIEEKGSGRGGCHRRNREQGERRSRRRAARRSRGRAHVPAGDSPAHGLDARQRVELARWGARRDSGAGGSS